MLRDLMRNLRNCTVIIKTSNGSQIKGEIIDFSEPQKGPSHKLGLLLLKTAWGMVLIRDWILIAFDGRL